VTPGRVLPAGPAPPGPSAPAGTVRTRVRSTPDSTRWVGLANPNGVYWPVPLTPPLAAPGRRGEQHQGLSSK
jgi:hypothetical protein